MEPGLTECEHEGLSGNCGPECPVFLAGHCENADEIKTELESQNENSINNA